MSSGIVEVIRFDDSSLQRLDLEELIFDQVRPISEFRLSEILGRGAYSDVSKVRDSVKNEIFAMKTIKKKRKDIGLGEDIFREITILKGLNHDNIIRLHDIAIGPGGLHIALILDYCTHTLAEVIDKYPNGGKIPIKQIKCIMKNIFGGLRYLHKNFIIHRDLTPPNCLINEAGVLKISDFGLSRRFTPNQAGTMSMTPGLVTIWYRPPEILFEATTYGVEVDLWSAGCILGELLKMKPLFKGQTDLQQINLIIDILGTPMQTSWPDFKNCKIPKTINLKMVSQNRLEEQFKEHQDTKVLEILSGLLIYDPKKRMTAEDCFEHIWLLQTPFPDKNINCNP